MNIFTKAIQEVQKTLNSPWRQGSIMVISRLVGMAIGGFVYTLIVPSNPSIYWEILVVILIIGGAFAGDKIGKNIIRKIKS